MKNKSFYQTQIASLVLSFYWIQWQCECGIEYFVWRFTILFQIPIKGVSSHWKKLYSKQALPECIHFWECDVLWLYHHRQQKWPTLVFNQSRPNYFRTCLRWRVLWQLWFSAFHWLYISRCGTKGTWQNDSFTGR